LRRTEPQAPGQQVPGECPPFKHFLTMPERDKRATSRSEPGQHC